MIKINFPIYLICIIFSLNGLSTLPTEATISTTSKISTVIQYPINSNLTKDGIIYQHKNQHHKQYYSHQYHQYKYQQQHHTQQENLGYLIGNCLTKPNISNCVTKLAIDTIEIAIMDNNTWNINPYISVVPNSDWHPKLEHNKIGIMRSTTMVDIIGDSSINDIDNDLYDILLNKIKNIAESRSIRVSLVPKETNEDTESRSKKGGGKDKGGAMVGVMVMVGVMAQMFMGKVLMLAGGAFLISKLALLFSILSGLKKSGGSSDHVIYTESGGGGGGHSS